MPLQVLDNLYLAGNILVSFRNIRNIASTEESYEKKKIVWDRIVSENSDASPNNRVTLTTINNNQVLTWRIINKGQISISFFCKDKSNKFNLTGAVKGTSADSTKADNVVSYMTNHVKFSQ